MKTLFTLVLVVVLALIGIGYYAENYAAPDGMKLYNSDKYKISFSYPETYFVTEGIAPGSALREHVSVMLVEDTEFNRKLMAGEIEGTEGPIAITFDMYQNNTDKQSLLGWMNNASVSNFKLSNGTHTLTSVAGAEAVKYIWDGLYQGDTTAFIHGDYIVAASVTYLTPEDQIRKDYEEVLKTVKLK